jgi:hypothetical protein
MKLACPIPHTCQIMGSLLHLEIMTYIRHNKMLQNKEYMKDKAMKTNCYTLCRIDKVIENGKFFEGYESSARKLCCACTIQAYMGTVFTASNINTSS